MATVRKSLIYSISQSYLVMIIQLGSSMVLARLLSPDEIGVFSVGAAVLAVAHMIRDFGVTTYIIQVKDLSKQHLKAAMGITIIASWTLAGIIYFSRYWIAQFYNEPRIEIIMAWMALNFIIIPLSSPIFALFQREMKFNIIFIISLVSTLAGVSTGIYLASKGYSYMSLVWSSIANISVSAFLATILRPKMAFILPSLKGSKAILSFGGKSSLSSIVGAIGHNAGELIIGKFMGFSSVAIYSKAQTLNTMISGNLLGSIQNVYFPVIAQHHREKKPIYPAFSKATSYISVIAFPIFGFLALNAEEIILIMFGNQWLESAKLIKILVISSCIYCLWRFIPVTLNAMGHPGVVLKMNLLLQIIRVLLILYAAQFSLEYIVLAFVGTNLIGMMIHFIIFNQYVEIKYFDFFIKKLLHNLVVSLFTLSAVYWCKNYCFELNGVALLSILSVALLAVFTISLFLFKHPLRNELRIKYGKI